MSDSDAIKEAILRLRQVGSNYSTDTHDEAVQVLSETIELAIRLRDDGRGNEFGVTRLKVICDYPALLVIESIRSSMRDQVVELGVHHLLNRMQHTPWLCELLVETEMFVSFGWVTDFSISNGDPFHRPPFDRPGSFDEVHVDGGHSDGLIHVEALMKGYIGTHFRSFERSDLCSIIEYLGVLLRKICLRVRMTEHVDD